jgi:rare lipoprotein A
MGRWIVIISLAVAQCPDLAGAAPPTTNIPLPKPRPVHRDHLTPAITAVTVPRVAKPIVESAVEELPTEESQEFRIEDAPVQTSTTGPAPVEEPKNQIPNVRTLAPAKSANGGCNGGKRIMSTYYWQGQRTASGQLFDPHGMTAAHPTLPFGTRLAVSNPRTGKSVIVVVNDRGPFRSGFGIDLSLGAAEAIGMRGTGAVCIQ